MGRLTDLVVISGFSGAGKSSVMNVFDDAGYFCVDNLPAGMIRSLAELFQHTGSKVERACVVSDLRAADYFEELTAVLDDLEGAEDVNTRLLFLEADEDQLLTRYRETRRRHPQARNGNVADGIRRERELLAKIRERADTVIDTTGLSASALRRKVASEMLAPTETGKLAVTFGSFGHKHGPARDADLVLDVRFLPNPHYVAELRPLTGHDARVVTYIERDGRLAEFYERVIPLLDFLVPQYVAEGKAHLTIAIGCTGGRHRSVAIVEHLAARYAERDDVLLQVVHRDAERASGHPDADRPASHPDATSEQPGTDRPGG
jgi:RNase adapter protein RapZ